MNSVGYRPEIDGLRTLAIVPVILCHTGLDVFSGGYVGVDVFFVISGYLIASILFKDISEKKFTLTGFYAKRIRRLLPALIVVVLCCIPLVWLTLLPLDAISFFNSIIGVVTFSSNFIFFTEVGYFQQASELKPLLHTWSLAVEEQFYILFPFFAFLLFKMSNIYRFITVFFLILLSLVLAEYQVYHNPSRAFFLLPARIWELLAGVMTALLAINFPVLDRKDRDNFLSLVGLLLILYSIVFYDSDTPFPGLYALPPVIGSMLILLFSSTGTIVYSVLANRVAVGVGLISYSLYLWHQPIFAFMRHQRFFEVKDVYYLLAIFLVFVLAYFTWRVVEVPCRSNDKTKPKPVVLTCITLMLFLFGSSYFLTYYSNKYEEYWLSKQDVETRQLFFMLEQEDINFKKYGVDSSGLQRLSDCRFNVNEINKKIHDEIIRCYGKYGSGVLIFGDSHAEDFFGMVVSRFEMPFIVGVTKGGCQLSHNKTPCFYSDLHGFFMENSNVFRRAIFEQAGFYLVEYESGRKLSRRHLASLEINEAIPRGLRINSTGVTSIVKYLGNLKEYVPITWLGPRIEHHIRKQQVQLYGCEYNYKLRPGLQPLFDMLDFELSKEVAKVAGLLYVSQQEMTNISFPDDFINCEIRYWTDGDHLSSYGETYFGARLPSGFLLND